MRKKGFLTYDEQIVFLKEKKIWKYRMKNMLKKYCLKQGIFR